MPPEKLHPRLPSDLTMHKHILAHVPAYSHEATHPWTYTYMTTDIRKEMYRLWGYPTQQILPTIRYLNCDTKLFLHFMVSREPFASVCSPWSLRDAEGLFSRLLPIIIHLLIFCSFFLPFLHWPLLISLWHPVKMCWASICLTLGVGNVDREEIEGNTGHTWSPSVTWQPVTIATVGSKYALFLSIVIKVVILTILCMCGARDGLRGLVHAGQVLLLSCSPHLSRFSRSTPAALSTLLCNLCPERFRLVKSNFCPHGNKAFGVIFPQMLLTSLLLPIRMDFSALGPAMWESHRGLLSV